MKLSVLLLVFLVGFQEARGQWQNVDVKRTIDLKTHVVKISTTISMKNVGSATNTFKVEIESSVIDRLAHLEATLVDVEGNADLKISQGKDSAFTVELPEKVDSQKEIEVKIDQIFTHALKPYPLEITQSQKQLVTYEGNVFFYSPYASNTQETTVELFSNVVENFSKYGTTDQEQSTIKYGGSSEYKNVPARSQKQMSLHFENNSPFLSVTKMVRVIEVSHWGNIAVEESIDILHTGAKFKGSFSRYDYQRLPTSGQSAVKSFKTILPASASDVYYRDQIGNISTSNLLVQDDSAELELRPRFPLFGGWKTNYYIGYNLPSYTYMYKTGDLHALRMRFVDHIHDDMVIDDFTLKIILPEGCKNISMALPYPADKLDDSLHYTYLDTVGRPVITYTKKNLVEQHIQDFTISYHFNRMMLLQEPLLLVGAFFLLFFSVIIIVRLDFSITHDKLSEARMRVQSVIEQVQEHQAKRSTCYKSYENAIKNYKANKSNAAAFSTCRKSIDKDHRECTTALNQLLPKLKDDGAESLDKVTQLMKMDQNIMEKYNHSIQLAEKLVLKRITKDQYVVHDQKNQKGIDDLKDKIDELTDHL